MFLNLRDLFCYWVWNNSQKIISACRNVNQIRKCPTRPTNYKKIDEMKNIPYFLPVVYIPIVVQWNGSISLHEDNLWLMCGLQAVVWKASNSQLNVVTIDHGAWSPVCWCSTSEVSFRRYLLKEWNHETISSQQIIYKSYTVCYASWFPIPTDYQPLIWYSLKKFFRFPGSILSGICKINRKSISEYHQHQHHHHVRSPYPVHVLASRIFKYESMSALNG